MGTESTRRRNRNKRLRKKEQKLPRIKHVLVRKNMFIIPIIISILTFLIAKTEIDNIRLYNKGVKTKAFVYKLHSLKTGTRSVYEFNVFNERYTGEDLNAGLGDSIDVVYLPKNPKINRNAEVLDQDCVIWLYRKIVE